MKLPASFVSSLERRKKWIKARTGDVAFIFGGIRYRDDTDNARDAHAATVPVSRERKPQRRLEQPTMPPSKTPTSGQSFPAVAIAALLLPLLAGQR